MKKAFSLIMVLILLLGMMVPAHAAGTPTLSISSGSVKAGESVTLTVSIKDNPGIAATILYIYFDTETFSFDPSKDIKASGSFREDGGVLGNSIEIARENGRYEGTAGKNGAMAFWYNGSGMNTDGDGALITIKLKVAEDAANGEHTIGLGYATGDTCNEDRELVALSTKSGKVTVSGGTDEKKPESPKDIPEFTDVSGHWAEKYIKQSAELGLVEGYMGLYRPDDTMTRAEFVTILWRAVGEPKPRGKASFTDLTQDWYKASVAWAEQNKIVNGMGGGLFEPNGKVTREQLVTILHRMAGTPTGMEAMFTGIYDGQFKDSAQIGTWAKAAMYWSVYEGIYCGEHSVEIGNALAPKASANRAQIAVMMIRYLNEE